MQVEFLLSVTQPRQLPPQDKPEIAFFGRSNVGKSTLLNKLFQTKNLARTSKTPGRTQWINFFTHGDQFYIVDLPGYGFSVTAKHERHKWQALVQAYLKRLNIEIFVFAFDIRRHIDDQDLEVLRMLSSLRPPLFVLTKTDKLSASAQKKQIQQITNSLRKAKISIPATFTFSKLQPSSAIPLRDSVFELMEQY